MTEPKRLILNLFEMNCVSHITHGLWRLPGNNRERFNDIEYWLELAQLLESGGFDAVFLADVFGAYDTFRGSADTAIREGLQIPSNDPLLVVPAMAAVTRHLCFGITFSTTYEPPFAFARRMSTLDHLTKGRVGWNIVTSYLPNAARNFGLDGEIEHDKRFDRADEYLEVLYKLWEGSWEEDAVVADRENGVYADPAKVHYINHVGEHFRVAGPHLAAPSRQRSPFLITATASPRGIQFAGRHAEALFTGGGSTEAVRDIATRVRAAAVAAGRAAGDVKFLVQAGVVVAATEQQARAKLAEYQRYSSVEGRLAHGGFGFDPTIYPRDALVRDVAGENAFGRRSRGPFRPDQTIGELLDMLADLSSGPFFAVGDPRQVADAIEYWLDEVGIDGINLRQHHSFDTARDFIEFVVPELRRRGRLRPYRDGETLRDRVHGGGDRLPDRHPGARYRRTPTVAASAS